MYQIKLNQQIPASLEDVWAFIASPKNLKHITPEYMGFEIRNEPLPEKMYEGMMISYTVKPILGIKMNWVTEITHIKEFEYFVDEQRFGPYTFWHHEHHLARLETGVEMIDIVSYKPPLGMLGKVANSLFIKNQLHNIFDYRFNAVEKIFGKFPT